MSSFANWQLVKNGLYYPNQLSYKENELKCQHISIWVFIGTRNMLRYILDVDTVTKESCWYDRFISIFSGTLAIWTHKRMLMTIYLHLHKELCKFNRRFKKMICYIPKNGIIRTIHWAFWFYWIHWLSKMGWVGGISSGSKKWM